MKRLFLSAIGSLILASTAPAIIDINSNGVSDPWERAHNDGELFAAPFDLQADPDADGWTNEQEAAAGTSPADPNPPAGFLRPEITDIPTVYYDPDEDGIDEVLTPETLVISWPTLPGKHYTLYSSPGLGVWLPIQQTYIGTGNIIEYYFPLTQPDKLFWRVAVTDIDSDGDTMTNSEEHYFGSNAFLVDGDYDGLSDLDEILTHHTNPMSLDSDEDGVSDWDEIVVLSTNPKSKHDGDGDGIPDDFEKYLAMQIVAYQPDPVSWGEYYAGLIVGDLDATHDYTAEEMPIGDLAPILASYPTSSAVPAEVGYFAQLQGRHNLLNGLRIPPEDEGGSTFYSGYYFQSSTDYQGISRSLDEASQLTSAYLLSQIGSVPWVANTFPRLREWHDSLGTSAATQSASEFHEYSLDEGRTSYEGQIIQSRSRIFATSLSHEPFERQYIRVTQKRTSASDAWETISGEPVKITIPKGKFSSGRLTHESPMMVGNYTRTILASVEIDYVDPNDANWVTTLPEKRVFLKDENLRIRIRINGGGLSLLDLEEIGFSDIYLTTSITRAGFPETALSIRDRACTVICSGEDTEIRAEMALFDLERLSLLPAADADDHSYHSTLDYANGEKSNFDDSQAFIDSMTTGGRGIPAGYANNKDNVTLSSNPPQSAPDKTFFQAAGAEVMSARFGSFVKSGLVMNQAEVFYFSGHGFPGTRKDGPNFLISNDMAVNGIDLKTYWNEDLHIAVMAGCSAVNINNLNPDPNAYSPATIGPDAGYYPGEFMNLIGPRYILGYGASAPADIHGAGGIVTSFVNAYLAAPLDPFSPWAIANYHAHAWNATAIEKNTKFGHFEPITIFGVPVDYVWNNTPFANW